MRSKFILMAAFLAALAVSPFFVKGADKVVNIKVRTILRLRTYTPVAVEGTRKCPVCSAQLPAAKVEDIGPKIFDELLDAKIQEIASCKFVVSGEQSRVAFALDSEEDRARVKSLSAALGADAVLYPVLLRYRERVGNQFAASQPAAVVFHLYLLDAGTLKVLWHAEYREEQQALSENLLQANKMLKRKFRWVTADRLVEDGLSKVFKSFPTCVGATQ